MDISMIKHEENIKKFIEKVKLDKTAARNIDYFTQLLIDHHVRFKNISKNDICIFGVSIPEEFIRALDLNPLWVLGGSFHMGTSVSDTLPRDVDPVVRSAYGMYKAIVQETKNTLNAIIPYQNDSFRKLSWIMKTEGTVVHEFDLPSIKDMNVLSEVYKNNVNKLIKDLENTYKRELKAYKLFAAQREINSAKAAIFELIQLNNEKPNLLSAEVLFLIMSAYYSTPNLKEYEKQVKKVIKEMYARQNQAVVDKPQLLVIGSPMFFPNNKIISMIEELGAEMKFYNNEISMFFEVNEIQGGESLNDMIEEICNCYYKRNYMPLNIIEQKSLNMEVLGTQGVLFHILKGEVVYDYELLKLEKLFKEKEIPVFRIETDYSPEDKEQLKIRIEAFIEMLRHSKLT
ncbi:2-hydroxyacyl-CoA dehydratase family protein [Clostridium aestuarii]|uniref:2-hydroxyacyl-CoA dehydratase family protein n=1 Tax=Clostridium aestuarii TaxID=338193 RepID=A0ABT4D337_9CLOT|nr:2-hydroxyacyl-CoA dehydratase family protein [Clostridium aestuarii]MCY6484615.1 2-hydroxyacyl-CoA dehydratase family protein [Clostridium aestuarii]